MADDFGSAIERMLDECRRDIHRVEAADLQSHLASGTLVVDTRPEWQRRAWGDLPGAVAVDRNVLEWRLDPTSPDRLQAAADPARPVLIVCQEGYSSSLAAHVLGRLGRRDVGDVIGGFGSWAALTG